MSSIMRGDATLAALLLSRESEVDPALAALYGVEAPASGWETRTLPTDERAGILTRASFLASHAHAANGSPPLRGVAVLTSWLCADIPPPPAVRRMEARARLHRRSPIDRGARSHLGASMVFRGMTESHHPLHAAA